MQRETAFYSDGLRLAARLFTPDALARGGCPAIVMCQGAIGRKEAFGFPCIAQRFAALGYAALIFDHRGFGASDGERGRFYPMEWVRDARDAVTFMASEPGIDPEHVSLFGASIGGGVAVRAGADDARVRCVVSVVGFGDGERMARAGRSDADWAAFKARVEADVARVVRGARSELVSRGEISRADPASSSVRARVVGDIGDARVPNLTLQSVARLMAFKPMEAARSIAPRAALFIGAEHDAVTPFDGVAAMHHQAGEPKRLERLDGLTHYEVYEEPHVSRIIALTDEWLRAH
ncbi:MAG: alpha/beta fold hydrolase [Dehalococcoidia bacterium]|nr:alpha/beta fold hydrolase [Dehalococcoidia bacterium]